MRQSRNPGLFCIRFQVILHRQDLAVVFIKTEAHDLCSFVPSGTCVCMVWFFPSYQVAVFESRAGVFHPFYRVKFDLFYPEHSYLDCRVDLLAPGTFR